MQTTSLLSVPSSCSPTAAPGKDDPPSQAALAAASEPATLADQLVADLVADDIRTYFGVPGGAIEPLFNAVARAQSRGQVRVVPMRSEAGAAFAADGYYRQTGRIAACLVTSGPGAANLLTATMSAEADRVPIVVLTAQTALGKEGRGALQDSSPDGHDLSHVLAACTRYSSVVSHPEQLGHKLARALARARGAPSGPVHLSLPADVMRARCGRSRATPRCTLPRRALDLRALAKLRRAVLTARAPVFYVGDDAGPGAERAIDLAHALGTVVISSPAGKRWIGHLDPAYRGVLGFSGNESAQAAIERADVVVAFGATFDELSTNAWSALPNVPVFVVDQHAEFAYRLPRSEPVLATARVVIEALFARTGKSQIRSARGSGSRHLPAPPRPGAVHPAELMAWLGGVLPDDVVVHVDAGNSFSWSTRDLARVLPDTYRVAMGLSTMCWAISAAIGSCVGRQRRTVCIAGDGSMLMSSLELTVAVEQRLPVTYVVLNDSGLGMVRHGQRLAGAESIAHEIAPVRFAELARACGACGVRVESSDELGELDLRWLADDEGGPCVIDVRIDREAVPPMADRVSGLALGVPR